MAKNKRCPFQDECEKKCEYEHNELECKYYACNAYGENGIPDQEERRKELERKHEEQLYEDELNEVDDCENGIVWIDIDRLHPHPDNPRKDLGDLTELSDSIKAKGVLQNLTVVRGHNLTEEEYKKASDDYREKPSEETRTLLNKRWLDTDYTVIIGHRRTEAARRAGLTKLPCIITDMTPAEQVQTMLLENMQRSDLTVYEQARGFQMMLDFGDSIEDLSVKTGFSKATVRKRLKMAKLDQSVLKEVANRQLSLMDFDRLYELDDIEEQNYCLKEMGTANFEQALQYRLKKQNMAKMLPKVKEEIKKLHATKIARSETYGGKYNSLGGQVFYYKWDGESPLFEKTSDKKMFYCLDEDYGTVALYTESERAKPVKKSPEEIEKEKQIEDAWNQADQLRDDMYNLRRQYVERFAVTTRNYDNVMDGAYMAAILHTITWCRSDQTGIHKIAGTENEPYGEKTRKTIDALKGNPNKLAKVIFCTLGDSEQNSYFNGSRKQMPQYGENIPLDVLYE